MGGSGKYYCLYYYRTGISSQENKTPYELFYEKHFDMSCLRCILARLQKATKYFILKVKVIRERKIIISPNTNIRLKPENIRGKVVESVASLNLTSLMHRFRDHQSIISKSKNKM